MFQCLYGLFKRPNLAAAEGFKFCGKDIFFIFLIGGAKNFFSIAIDIKLTRTDVQKTFLRSLKGKKKKVFRRQREKFLENASDGDAFDDEQLNLGSY